MNLVPICFTRYSQRHQDVIGWPREVVIILCIDTHIHYALGKWLLRPKAKKKTGKTKNAAEKRRISDKKEPISGA